MLFLPVTIRIPNQKNNENDSINDSLRYISYNYHILTVLHALWSRYVIASSSRLVNEFQKQSFHIITLYFTAIIYYFNYYFILLIKLFKS